MGNVVKSICVVILLIGTSVSAWGYTVTIHQTLTGCTEHSGNPTTFESDRTTTLSLYYDIESGYDPTAYPSGMQFFTGSTELYLLSSNKCRWHDDDENGVYQLDIYFQNNIPISNSDFYITLPLTNCNSRTLTFANATVNKNFGDAAGKYQSYSLSMDGGTETWESSNESVATVNNSGTVTIVGAGTTTITAKRAQTTIGYDNYCAVEGSYTLNVAALAPTLSHNASGKELTVSNISSTGARISGGVVTAKGGANISSYGFVVGTANTVTYGTSGAKQPSFSGDIALNTAFGSKSVSGLTPNTTYYVKATAYNGSQRGYSDYISFTTLQRYAISYDNNTGGGSISAQYKDHGATATLNNGTNFSKTGYSLSKWHTDADGTSGTDYALGGSYTINADVTMYAVWTPNPYTITLNNQGADTEHEGTESISVTYGASTNLTSAIDLPERTGYTFGGYYTETNGGGVQIIAADGNVIADANDGGAEIYTDESKQWLYANDITLYAKWTAKTISLVLDKNNSDVSSTTSGSATIKFGNSALEDGTVHATRGGDYNLVGYYAEAETTTKVLESNGTFAAENVTGYITSGKWSRETTPTTLFAKWSLATYTVTFNMHGHGSAIANQVVESGELAAEPTTPEAEDWRFLGWYTDDGAGNATNTEFNFSTSITGNTTIHAKWEAVTYSTTLKAWCDPDIDITGDIHLTSVNGVYVNSTAATNNLLRITSSDLAGVTKLAIKYLDADNGDAEVANASSLFRLCNDGTVNYNYADGSQIDVSASNTCDLTYSIKYTPNAYNEINHYKLQITMKRGTRDVKTVTHDLYGRSLPEEFVVASKFNGEWYALPNTLEATEGAAKAVAGIKITVDNTTTPTKAVYAPNTTVYQGEGRYAAGTNIYGVRLTDGTNHLQVSSTASNNLMWLSTTGSANNQDWWLSSSDFGEYSLTIPSAGTKKLGMVGGNIGYYASPTSPSEKIYLLPIENKLVDNPAIVTEWGQKSVILDVDAQGIAGAQARIGNGEAERASSFGQTLTSVKGSATKYNYTVRFSTTDFSAHKGELLYIDWLDGEDNVVSTSQLTIPWIIALDGTMSTIESRKTYWQNEEVHVLPGVTLTADAGTFSGVTIKQLEIYPGATVKVTTGTLNVTDLVLRYGWTRASGKNYDVAQLQIKRDVGGANLTTTRAYADWYIDYDQYYPIAVPWQVTTANMSYKNSNSAASAGVKLRYYDGASRASNIQAGVAEGANWKEYSPLPATLEPSKGYAMTARRPTGKAFSIIRMPLTIPSASWTALGEQGEVSGTHKDQVSVTGWGIGTTTPWYAVGWNFIGNPYMSTFNGNNEGISGKLQYQNGGSIRYATIPDIDFMNYDQVNIAEANLKPASGFFVQANNAEAQNITFSSSQIVAPSVALRYTATAEVLTEQDAYIRLSSETAHDQMGLIIADEFTAEYETNADLVKILGEANTLKTYMSYNNMDMAYLAINQELAQEWIPVVVKIPETGQYTFSLTNSSEVEQLAGVYLIDYNTNSTITNLIDDNYIFTANAGTYTNRFAINAIVGERQTPTAIDALDIGSDPDRPIKFIFHDKVFILYHGIIYDSTGKRVKEVRL